LVIVEFPLSEDQINDEPYASWRGEQAARGSAKVTVVRLYNVSARTELLVSGSIGVVAGVAVGAIGSPKFGALVGWDVAALFYLFTLRYGRMYYYARTVG
jgi:hypothetical protein